MDKIRAIEIATAYLYTKNNTQPVSIDTIDLLDQEPTQFEQFWCFKAYYENLNPRRPDGIQLSTIHPFYLISKQTEEITLASWNDYYTLKKI